MLSSFAGSGGKPPFCIDWGHPKHLFGDMVNTFRGVEFLQIGRNIDALERGFYHVSTP
jgi:hypothetical protein